MSAQKEGKYSILFLFFMIFLSFANFFIKPDHFHKEHSKQPYATNDKQGQKQHHELKPSPKVTHEEEGTEEHQG